MQWVKYCGYDELLLRMANLVLVMCWISVGAAECEQTKPMCGAFMTAIAFQKTASKCKYLLGKEERVPDLVRYFNIIRWSVMWKMMCKYKLWETRLICCFHVMTLAFFGTFRCFEHLSEILITYVPSFLRNRSEITRDKVPLIRSVSTQWELEISQFQQHNMEHLSYKNHTRYFALDLLFHIIQSEQVFYWLKWLICKIVNFEKKMQTWKMKNSSSDIASISSTSFMSCSVWDLWHHVSPSHSVSGWLASSRAGEHPLVPGAVPAPLNPIARETLALTFLPWNDIIKRAIVINFPRGNCRHANSGWTGHRYPGLAQLFSATCGPGIMKSTVNPLPLRGWLPR